MIKRSAREHLVAAGPGTRVAILPTLLAAACLVAPGVLDAAGTVEGSFDAAENGNVLALVEESGRTDLRSALEDAGRNWPELAGALEALDGEQRDACLTLIEGMPHLDRLEMTASTLVEHVSYAFRARAEMPYDVPDDMFAPYILTYRIGEEPIEPWRAELFRRFAPVASREGTVAGTAMAINAELKDSIEERESGFYGPTQSPLMTLRSGSGTENEIAILACAALKAVGIPSRRASVAALGQEDGGAHWMEVYDGSKWLPLYPMAPEAFGDYGYVEREFPENVTVVSSSSAFDRVLVTEMYTETGVVEFEFLDNGLPASGFEHFSVSVRNGGALVPLDALEAVADEGGRFSATVGEGWYVALAGVRDARGNPFVMMQDVRVEPGDAARLAFDVTPRGEGAGLDAMRPAGLDGAITVVVLALPGSEPSLRMMPLVAGAAARRPGAVDLVCGIVSGDPGEVDELSRLAGPSASVIDLPEGAASFESEPGVFTDVPVDASAFPVVLVRLSAGGDLVMESRGYDLNIARRLEAAIDGALSRLADGSGAGGP